ncbi:hypothetical protein FRC17_003154 [Serendipita sp. 399]|nr:hypothetical protein FRC17_003154 [Serendipita sp. 399]
MPSIVHLPEELVLDIVRNQVSLADSFHLIQVSKDFYKQYQSKAFWLHIVRRAQMWRPIHNTVPWSKLLIEELRSLAFNAIRLTGLFEKQSIQGLREVHSLPVKQKLQSDGIMTQEDFLMYTWPICDGTHAVSVSIQGKLTLWDVASQKRLASVDIEGPMQCWDSDTDVGGITIIVNVRPRVPGGERSLFHAYRYDFDSKECTQVALQTIHGTLESNYIKGTLMGCIFRDNGATSVYMIDLQSQKEALIQVIAPRVSAEYFSFSISAIHLGYYADMGSFGCYYALLLDDLKGHLTSPMSESKIRLPLMRKYYFDRSEDLEESDWGPRCRYLWDDRLGVFSRAAFGPLWSTLTLLDERYEEFEEESRPSHRAAPSPSIRKIERGWDLYTAGIFGKASVWLEYCEREQEVDDEEEEEEEGAPLSKIRLCFAEFPPVEDVWTSRGNGGNGEREFRLDESFLPNRPIVDDGAFSVPRRPSRGHTCEYVLPDGWMDQFEGGIWSMEYDDAKGQLMLTTGSGQVIIYEVC